MLAFEFEAELLPFK